VFYPPQYVSLYDQFSAWYRIHRSSYATTSMIALTSGTRRDAYVHSAYGMKFLAGEPVNVRTSQRPS